MTSWCDRVFRIRSRCCGEGSRWFSERIAVDRTMRSGSSSNSINGLSPRQSGKFSRTAPETRRKFRIRMFQVRNNDRDGIWTEFREP